MQLTRNRFGRTRKALATSVVAALLVSGIGATSAHADAATDAAIADVKTSVTAVNDNVKLLAAQVTTLQAAVATLIDSFGDQLAQIIETQATLVAALQRATGFQNQGFRLALPKQTKVNTPITTPN